MNLETYLLRKKEIEKSQTKFRELCVKCLQPEFSCYCSQLQPFDPRIKFAILMHPIEHKRRIATGRMSHLSLQHSELLVGQNYTENVQLNSLLSDISYQPVILYPGRMSLNLSTTSENEKKKILPDSKKLLILVIDGTWATARRMMKQSQNLISLPRVCFTPSAPSRFRVRKQPGVECYSTIEAIHQTIELLGSTVGFETESRKHDRLLEVFDQMVERQLQFIRHAYDNPKPGTYRKPRYRVA